MILLDFAKKYKLVASNDEVGDTVIVGKHGDISEYGKGMLAAAFYGDGPSAIRARRISDTVKLNMGIGGSVKGSDEDVFLFTPTNKNEARWFIRALGIKSTRKLPPGCTTALAEWRAKKGTQK